ncbi:hypothetical protein EVAR_36211_1 [Eumeta japonica]|uniref:Uncharacterized protein n=1 Tax=Eumeta variegata TaxID=151549 RepID=A0A4C1VUF5_EUMVA|nr:hypothetical protein EVAR_36211_1 [Eumeta japonica]
MFEFTAGRFLIGTSVGRGARGSRVSGDTNSDVPQILQFLLDYGYVKYGYSAFIRCSYVLIFIVGPSRYPARRVTGGRSFLRSEAGMSYGAASDGRLQGHDTPAGYLQTGR